MPLGHHKNMAYDGGFRRKESDDVLVPIHLPNIGIVAGDDGAERALLRSHSNRVLACATQLSRLLERFA
ncbi:hypothetical protein MOKP45_06900 [Mycobacterium avium subsp. hominissuis]|uniref:Uncharacterized protein n=1 Tax=Mycobacterium avium subsp. hominissuis TaxID=439334 RepID=A0AAI8SI05_MYCAV|nr:hypothetical protein JPH1_00100 [Mycobacterium avium subsp. hominissuis]